MRERGAAVGRVDAAGQHLRTEVERAGYYPELICDVLDVAVAGEVVDSFLVHPRPPSTARRSAATSRCWR